MTSIYDMPPLEDLPVDDEICARLTQVQRREYAELLAAYREQYEAVRTLWTDPGWFHSPFRPMIHQRWQKPLTALKLMRLAVE